MRAVAHALERLRAAAGTGLDPLIRAKGKLLHGIGQGVNGNAVLFGHILEFLKVLHLQASHLCHVANFGNPLCKLADAANDLVQAANSQPARDAAEQALAEAAERLHCAAHGLLDAGSSGLGFLLDCPEVSAALALRALKVALILVQAGFEGD